MIRDTSQNNCIDNMPALSALRAQGLSTNTEALKGSRSILPRIERTPASHANSAHAFHLFSGHSSPSFGNDCVLSYSFRSPVTGVPILLTRTPYNADQITNSKPSSHMEVALEDGLDNTSHLLNEGGYIRVVQDIRGKFRSGGNFGSIIP